MKTDFRQLIETAPQTRIKGLEARLRLDGGLRAVLLYDRLIEVPAEARPGYLQQVKRALTAPSMKSGAPR